MRNKKMEKARRWQNPNVLQKYMFHTTHTHTHTKVYCEKLNAP